MYVCLRSKSPLSCFNKHSLLLNVHAKFDIIILSHPVYLHYAHKLLIVQTLVLFLLYFSLIVINLYFDKYV